MSRARTRETADVETLRRAIDRQAAESRDVHVGFLASLLRQVTISSEDGLSDEAKAAFEAAERLLRLEAERLGLRFHRHPAGAMVIEWPGRDPDAPVLGVATHVDVVPVCHEWTYPPFAGAVIEGEIWGRGAQDDKGPLAAVLSAIDVLRRTGYTPERTIRLLIGVEEETTDWPDMDALLEDEGSPDEVIVPDGAFPVTAGEKGIVTVAWDGRVPIGSGDEGGLLRVRSLVSGVRPNMVPDEADLLLEATSDHPYAAETRIEETILRFDRSFPAADLERLPPGTGGGSADTPRFALRFHGHAAHAALPDHGRNAALDALAFLTLLEGLDARQSSVARFLFDRLHPVDGRDLGIDHEHPVMGPTTVNLGVLRIAGDSVHAEVNVRFPFGLQTKDIETAFRRAARPAPTSDDDATRDLLPTDITLETRCLGRPQDPFLLDPDDHPEFFRGLQTAYEAVKGYPCHTRTLAGTTYAKLFPLGVGFGPVDVDGGEAVRVHEPNERVSVERHLENIRIYALALRLLSGPERGS